MNRNSNRLNYLDWMRGLAVVLMIETHSYESWLQPRYRGGEWFWLSQFLGGFAAPLFLLLVGVSLALVLDRLRQKNATQWECSQKVVRRSIWILFLAYAYRLEQALVWSDWREFFRVDILNCIGASMLIVGLASALFATRRANIVGMGLLTAAVVVVTPWVYPIRAGLPHVLLGYLNGDGHPYYFSLFPWIAFPFTGITFGYALLEARTRGLEDRFVRWTIVGGICAYAAGREMWNFPVFQYGFFDYSLTSPHYYLVRLGWLSIILYGAYHWSLRKNAARWSPMRIFGQTSLLVYWLHLEIVYGPLLYRFKQALSLRGVLLNLIWLIPAMLGVAEIQLRGVRNSLNSVRLRLPLVRRESAVE